MAMFRLLRHRQTKGTATPGAEPRAWQPVLYSTRSAARAGEAVRKDAAFEIAPQRALGVGGVVSRRRSASQFGSEQDGHHSANIVARSGISVHDRNVRAERDWQACQLGKRVDSLLFESNPRCCATIS